MSLAVCSDECYDVVDFWLCEAMCVALPCVNTSEMDRVLMRVARCQRALTPEAGPALSDQQNPANGGCWKITLLIFSAWNTNPEMHYVGVRASVGKCIHNGHEYESVSLPHRQQPG